MNLENLTPEQIEKAKACNTVDELLELSKSEGVELTDEQLASISGGWSDDSDGGSVAPPTCPNCGSSNIVRTAFEQNTGLRAFACNNCQHTWIS